MRIGYIYTVPVVCAHVQPNFLLGPLAGSLSTYFWGISLLPILWGVCKKCTMYIEFTCSLMVLFEVSTAFASGVQELANFAESYITCVWKYHSFRW